VWKDFICTIEVSPTGTEATQSSGIRLIYAIITTVKTLIFRCTLFSDFPEAKTFIGHKYCFYWIPVFSTKRIYNLPITTRHEAVMYRSHTVMTT